MRRQQPFEGADLAVAFRRRSRLGSLPCSCWSTAAIAVGQTRTQPPAPPTATEFRSLAKEPRRQLPPHVSPIY
jgi:hypothetical protein